MAYEIGPVIGIKGEAEYRSQINNIITQTKTLHAEMRAMESGWTKETSARQKAADKTKVLTSAIEKQKQIVEQNSRMLAESAAKYGENDTKTQKWRQAVANATTELNKLEAELRQVPNQIQALGQDMQAAGQKVEAAGKKMTSAGKTLSKTVTAPIAAVGAASVKMAADFETAMAKVSSIADETEVSYDDMRKAILDLSNETGVAATDIAENVYQAISAGQDTAQAVNFVQKTTKLAKSGFAETGEALDVLTTILNAYGLEASQVDSVSDKLIQTQNLGKTTVAQLAQNMGSVIPTAAAYGVELDNLAAGYVTLTKNGIGTASATTYLNSMIDELGKTGSKSANVLKDKTGKSFKELMDSGMSLEDVLQIVAEGAEETGVSISDMFGNKNAKKAANSLIQNADDFTGALDSMGKAVGTTDAAFAKVTDTSAARFKKVLNEAKNTGIDLGQAILTTAAPALKDLAEKIKGGLQWFRNLDDSQKKAIIKFAGIAAVIGPVLTIGGKLVETVGKGVQAAGKLVEGIGTLLAKFGLTTAAVTAETAAEGANATAKGTQAAATVAATTAQEGLNAAMLANPAMLLVAGIAALAVGVGVMVAKYRAANKEALDASARMKDLRNSTADMKAELDSSAKATETEGRRVKDLATKLKDLNGKTDLTSSEQAELNRITAELNRTIPGLGLEIDKNTGRLKGNTNEINNNIDAWVRNYDAQLKQKQLELILDDLAQAERDLSEAQKEVYKWTGEVGNQQARVVTGAYGMAGAVDTESQKILANTSALQEAKTTRDELQNTVSELRGEYDQIANSIDTEALAMSESVGDNEMAGEALEGLSDSAEVAEEGLDSLALDASEQMTKLLESIQSAVQSSMTLFDEFNGGEKTTSEALLKNLNSQIDGVTNWEANLSKLLQMGGTSVQGLVQALFEAGPSTASAVQALVDGGAEKLGEIAEKWNKKQEISDLGNEEAIALKTSLGLVDAAAEQAMGEVDSTMASGWNTTKTTSQTGAQAAVNAAETALTTGKTTLGTAANQAGAEMTAQLAAGETSGTAQVQAAAQTVANYADIQPYANSMAAQMSLVGSYITAQFASGMRGKGSDVGDAMKSLISRISSSRGSARKAGNEIGKAIGGGVTASSGSIRAAINTITTIIKSGLTTIQAQQSPARTAGQNIAQSIGSGLTMGTARIRTANQSIQTTVTNMITNVRSKQTTASSAGQAVSAAVGSGLTAGKKSVTTATKALATEVGGLADKVKAKKESVKKAASGVGDAVASGLSSASGSVKSNASSLASSATSPLSDLASKGKSWGQDMGNNFASGIAAARPAAVREAQKTAKAVSDILKHSTPKKGPMKDDDVWGLHMGENFARGISAAIPDVSAAAMSMAKAAEVAADPAIDPSVVSGRGGLTEAITQSIDMSALGLDPDALYSAVRNGASDAGIRLVIGERELGRVLRDMGVVFAA